VKVTIERLGHLGDGIAEGPVFGPRALPGETIEGALSGDFIADYRIITSSPDRVAAPCRHYKGCGGCGLQHASDAFVARWKVEVVRQALEARNLAAPIRALHTSPPRSRRRATFAGKRTKKGATVGFHAPSSDVIRDVPDCLLIRPSLAACLPVLSPIVELGGSRKGEMRLTVTETDTGLDLSITGGKPLDVSMTQEIVAIAMRGGFVRVSWDGETLVSETPPVTMFGSAPVPLPPGAFLQATAEGEAALLSSVSEALADAKGPVADLFSGVGTFALPLAAKREVHAVEGERAMLAALDQGWRHGQGLHRVTTECRDLFRRPIPSDDLRRYNAVIIDPPRAGAEAQTTELAQSGVPHVAFVSCNPVTFARDAEILTRAGYDLRWLDVVDQFRWSPHVELVAYFSLA
jgi:23S rRNA (uracil1939-C5)-methyltransferase